VDKFPKKFGIFRLGNLGKGRVRKVAYPTDAFGVRLFIAAFPNTFPSFPISVEAAISPGEKGKTATNSCTPKSAAQR
jgi:hypothetical protein